MAAEGRRVKRAEVMAIARTQATDGRCINHKRGMGRRAKRQGAKRVRQHLKKQL